MGLEKNASPEEIKRAYRKLARKYHPDVSKEADAENKFKELGEAYEVLKDPEKRAKYDQYGRYWQQASQEKESYQPSSSPYQEQEAEDFEAFINSIFQNRAYQEPAADIHAKLAINLEDSFLGAEKTLQLHSPSAHSPGQVETRTVKVKIPRGISDKQHIRLKGQGNKNRKGHAGDLYIEISFLPHPVFHVEQKSVYLDLPISPWEAVLGASIQVPTLGGPVKLTIPKLSQTGKQMRLKGRGLPGTPAGDQIVTLRIEIPQTENETMTKLFQQMAETIQFNPRAKLGVR